ncbi:MAG: SRPBCC family protein [Bauldia sp.]|uniref:SRPBCC family protein n=1 Tax=Bauldia sp. TaxID=2575872 RepID=UPI001DC851EB|nr:SRPBCC family protein [Bauldia sp.]MCB1488873.1 SRPBCC family protein [Bauldia sp.]MCB1494276.1 SRPBCC family protein [Bauldia sp.]
MTTNDENPNSNTSKKKIVGWVAIGLAALIVLALAGGFLMPRHRVVSRSTEIAAPPSDVFPLVGDLRQFNEWSPWFERDPQATYTFTGPTDGVGQTFHWMSETPDVGSGSMTITAIEPGEEVAIAVEFADQGTAETSLAVAAKGAGSVVTWDFSTDLGLNPIARYFGASIDEAVGADFEHGLAKLKALAEAPPETPDGE